VVLRHQTELSPSTNGDIIGAESWKRVLVGGEFGVPTTAGAKADVFDYIERFYNP